MNNLPKLAITMGDPAGIGPEITLKALLDSDIAALCQPIIIGDLQVLNKTASEFGIDISLSEDQESEAIQVVDLKNVPEKYKIGIDAATTGKASAEYIVKAVEMWKNGDIDAVCTAPISKKAIHLGGFDYPGHTEFLAELTNTQKFAMSFFADELRVVLLSTHVSLKRAIELVTTDSLVDLIKFSSDNFSQLLSKNIKIAVAGLNPHASEFGLFGEEESLIIEPAIERCREIGIDVHGPFSPDTIFLRGYRGDFDAVVACYHDQATIAVKSLSFGSSVNVTLGLPLIRTSVDHGTAYDIAGKNIADDSSMRSAIKLAAKLSLQNRTEFRPL